MEINTDRYKLFGRDIRTIEDFKHKLTSLGVNTKAPTLVLTECLLVYMHGEESEPILKGIS